MFVYILSCKSLHGKYLLIINCEFSHLITHLANLPNNIHLCTTFTIFYHFPTCIFSLKISYLQMRFISTEVPRDPLGLRASSVSFCKTKIKNFLIQFYQINDFKPSSLPGFQGAVPLSREFHSKLKVSEHSHCLFSSNSPFLPLSKLRFQHIFFCSGHCYFCKL